MFERFAGVVTPGEHASRYSKRLLPAHPVWPFVLPSTPLEYLDALFFAVQLVDKRTWFEDSFGRISIGFATYNASGAILRRMSSGVHTEG